MKQEDLDILDQYLRGELDDEKKSAVDLRLQQDENFSNLIDTLRQAKEAASDLALKAKLEKIHEQENFDHQQFTISKRTVYYLVAACLVLVMFGLWLWQPLTDNRQLVSSYMTIYDDYLTNRNSDATRLTEAMGWYNDQQFDKATEILREISDNKNRDVAFYLGLSYLYDQQYDSACKYLTRVLAESPKYDEQSRWFLALSLLSEDQVSEARGILEEIGEDDYQYEAAQELLEELTD